MSEENELTHEVLARGVAICGGKILLCKNKKSSHSYLPGGHIEPGESATYALEREMLEELGVAARAEFLLGAAEHCFTTAVGTIYEINLIFMMSLSVTPAVPASCEDWLDFFWWPLDELAEASLEPASLRSLLPQWVRNPVKQRIASSYN